MVQNSKDTSSSWVLSLFRLYQPLVLFAGDNHFNLVYVYSSRDILSIYKQMCIYFMHV